MRSPAAGAAVLAATLFFAACADRPTPLDPAGTAVLPTPGLATLGNSENASRHQRLASRLARALADDGFRASVYRALSESPEREGNLRLKRQCRMATGENQPQSLVRNLVAQIVRLGNSGN